MGSMAKARPPREEDMESEKQEATKASLTRLISELARRNI
uniref:Uncharacterized protein n=1 Tax=Arundo donax TaxID=35708 RepID=A0A0A9Q9P0_ARUDO